MTVLEIKAMVRFRDGNRCAECGMTNEAHLIRYGRQLDVHRTTPGSEYTMAGCVTLCRPCHSRRRSPKGTQDIEGFPLRFSDARLARAIADRARRMRRSINQEILFTLEESVRRDGSWPPDDE